MMRLRSGFAAAAAAATGAALLAGAPAHAADNTVAPRVELGALWNDNLRLLPSQFDNEVYGPYIDAAVQFASRSPLTDFTLTPRVRATQYFKNQDDESTDWFVLGTWEHRGERSRTGLEVNFADQDVVTSQILFPQGGALGRPGTGDLGLLQIRNKVKELYATPHFDLRTSERTELQLGGMYSKADYDRTIPGSQVDYDYLIGNVGWSWRYSERVRVLAAVDFTNFDPQSGGYSSNGKGVRLEAWHDQTERLRTFVRVGAMRNTTDGLPPTADDTSTTVVLGAGVERRLERGHLLLQANRSVDPNGTGQLLKRNEAYLEWLHAMTQRTELTLGVRSVWAKTIDTAFGNLDQRYYVATGGIAWRKTRALSFFGRYERTDQHYDTRGGDASSNAVRVGLVYEPERRD